MTVPAWFPITRKKIKSWRMNPPLVGRKAPFAAHALRSHYTPQFRLFGGAMFPATLRLDDWLLAPTRHQGQPAGLHLKIRVAPDSALGVERTSRRFWASKLLSTEQGLSENQPLGQKFTKSSLIFFGCRPSVQICCGAFKYERHDAQGLRHRNEVARDRSRTVVIKLVDRKPANIVGDVGHGEGGRPDRCWKGKKKGGSPVVAFDYLIAMGQQPQCGVTELTFSPPNRHENSQIGDD